MQLLKWDGHTHTAFCPHGTSAELSLYLDRAVELGFSRYSVTEHSPVPAGWINDEVLMQELAMSWEDIPDYIAYVEKHKQLYEDKLEVLVGMELDYLHGRTDEGLKLLDQFGGRLEELVVSLHYLPGKGGMRSIDYTPDDFKEGLLAHYGSMEAVVDEYYNHLEAAIEWASSLPGRKRVGHINLIEKFRQVLPELDRQQLEKRQRSLLPLLQKAKVGVDVNTAGLRVPACGKPYVESWFIQECISKDILVVFGSDAHRPEHVGEGWSFYEKELNSTNL
ncbi:histidinol-phosphatase HisJ [Paenibacillus senegalensis]|uniref:histidinol-phosphatase HisJ n=1 Tax=Paenibacillus senegalensis TaxID=1465766 RepID=UPI0002893CAA|nr:histidinol-phosphatase HisJ [Paenibacillus senegalensis]